MDREWQNPPAGKRTEPVSLQHQTFSTLGSLRQLPLLLVKMKPRIKVRTAKLSVFSPSSKHHPLHLGLKKSDFTKVFGKESGECQIIAIWRSNEEPKEVGHMLAGQCGSSACSTGLGGGYQPVMFGVVVPIDVEPDILKINPGHLLCSKTCLSHYGFTEEEYLYFHPTTVYPIERVVLAAKTDKSFEWAKSRLFTTGLLLSVCQNPILVRTGDAFLPPFCSLFANEESFTMDLLLDLTVLESSPLTQGILTVGTEIVVVKTDVINDTTSNVKSKKGMHLESKKGAVTAVVLSDFAVSFHIDPESLFREQILSSTIKELSENQQILHQMPNIKTSMKYEVLKHYDSVVKLFGANGQTIDLSNVVGLSERTMKNLGLFSGSLVEIALPQSQKKAKENEQVKNVTESGPSNLEHDQFTNTSDALEKNTSDALEENTSDALEENTSSVSFPRVAQVQMIYGSQFDDDIMYMVPTLIFNILRDNGCQSQQAEFTVQVSFVFCL